MTSSTKTPLKPSITSFTEFAQAVDYSLMTHLQADPDANPEGNNHSPRQVFSGHYVPVTPTALPQPEYITHSPSLFAELGLADTLAQDDDFIKLFSGDVSAAQPPMHHYGWATGYALSIYGREYIHQCPFGTGNGYGDGRAISIFEGLFEDKRWEMQLKGGGPTPYCRGADGRAVLRSSVREFLAQEFMYALGVPTSRSLSLYVSRSETVQRPWYSDNSQQFDPDILVENPVAISTRVAPSFLRVGQLELFARRVYQQAHDKAFDELRQIVKHLIEREYHTEIDKALDFHTQVVQLASLFSQRLIDLVCHWIRVGYCQGNFNSDNCAAGGFTLDYGPFGFCEVFDSEFQPWTGGGEHFAFFNQPRAAEANFHMFWASLRPLLPEGSDELSQLDKVREAFAQKMLHSLEAMWASKLGLKQYDAELCQRLIKLLSNSEVDYTVFFRELSQLPYNVESLLPSFYVPSSDQYQQKLQSWLNDWRQAVLAESEAAEVSAQMLATNPKYTWREWLVVPAYQQAMQGDYSLIKELQAVLSQPYAEQSEAIAGKYYRLRPKQFMHCGGVSHYSCSS